MFPKSGAAAIVGSEHEEVVVYDWLDALCERETISRRVSDRYPGEIESAFRHDLLREAAYATLTDSDRVLGHRLCAEWLEEHEYESLAQAHGSMSLDRCPNPAGFERANYIQILQAPPE